MSIDPLSDAKIIDSWGRNAAPWTNAVRGQQIESRRLVTDRAIVEATLISPHIERLHLEGAVRGLGAAGLELDRVHHTAESLAKAELALLVIVLISHAFRANREAGARDAGPSVS